MPKQTSREIDVTYAISVLLATGAVVQTDDDGYQISTKDGRTFEVTGLALVELAHDEARRRRESWQHTEDMVQLLMFEHEDTPRFEVHA